MMAKTGGVEQLILEALERAIADPLPRKLHGTKAKPGVFLSSTAIAKSAGQRCLQLGLLEKRGELKSRSRAESLYGITPAGIRHLAEHDPVSQLLAATRDGTEKLARTAADWQQALAAMQEELVLLRETVQGAVARLQPPEIKAWLAAVQVASSPSSSASENGAAGGASAATETESQRLCGELLGYLQQQKRQTPMRPVELPLLYRFARSRQPALTLGQFHDLLRRMSELRQVRLSPFTQAMHQLPEPECALIVGREVMYYVEGI